MQFRPCIDIHNGKVKQIVGSSLKDEDNHAADNFIAKQDAGYYAGMYKKYGLKGGHVILLNPKDSPYYREDVAQAELALAAYQKALQVGGGINAENAPGWIEAGASHVIVTSYIFADGKIHYDRLEQMVNAVGKEHLVLDLSCRVRDGNYYIVTDRWQKFTDMVAEPESLKRMGAYCDELLVHAVDVEGRQAGIDKKLIEILAACEEVPVTYAGGIKSMEDISYIEETGHGNINFTIGSALDLFGGVLPFEIIAEKYR